MNEFRVLYCTAMDRRVDTVPVVFYSALSFYIACLEQLHNITTADGRQGQPAETHFIMTQPVLLYCRSVPYYKVL